MAGVRSWAWGALASFAVALLVHPSGSRADYPIFYQRYTADPTGLEYGGRRYLYASHDLDDQTSYVMRRMTWTIRRPTS